nr:hypothetical protein [Pandoravirus aubagnensis]
MLVRIAMTSRPCITGDRPSRATGVFFITAVSLWFFPFRASCLLRCGLFFDDVGVREPRISSLSPIGSWLCRAAACVVDRLSRTQRSWPQATQQKKREKRDLVSIGVRDIAKKNDGKKDEPFFEREARHACAATSIFLKKRGHVRYIWHDNNHAHTNKVPSQTTALFLNKTKRDKGGAWRNLEV